MRKLIVLLAAAGIPAAAQPPAAGGAGPQPQMARRIASPPVRVEGACAIVPMRLSANIPTVEVMIGGRGPYRFAIDTGAQGHGRISPGLAQTLGLATIGEVRTPAPGGTVDTRPVFGVPAFSVGGITFRDAGLVASSARPGPAADWDGVLGIDLFNALTLAIDYGNGAVAISGATIAGGVAARFDRVPSIPIEIDGRTVQADLDTGNGAAALFLSEAMARSIAHSGPSVERGRARTSFGEFAIMEAPIAAPVRVGGFALPVRSVSWPSARGEANLGSRGLAGTVLRVDRRSGRVAIETSGAPPTCG